MNAVSVIAIAAMDEDRVIGRENRLPWDIPADLKRFSQLTKGHAVLMGRKTYESLPAAFRPLPGRKNIVISRSPERISGGAEAWASPEECVSACRSGLLLLPTGLLWIIGSEQIYRQTAPLWDEVRLTLVQGRHPGDAFFPEFEDRFNLLEREDHPGFSFLHYKRR